MKNIFRNYWDWVLGLAGFAILALIIWIFSWGVLLISSSMTRAFGALGQTQTNLNFNLDQAQHLDLKGLQN